MLYRDPATQLAVVLGIAVGASGGLMAAIDTGDAWRYLGAGIFVAITVSLYGWHFHLKS